jgi:anhydro-N-acetylmuramic acid kinase
MIKSSYSVLGVMSGTSLDGIDVAHIHFSKEGQWNFSIQAAQTFPYTSEWKDVLSSLHLASEKELDIQNIRYTALLGQTILGFIQSHEISNLDAVCSHGHTILHEPSRGVTLQIGNLKDLATHLNQVVVCDFRSQDVAMGGQGAPLVPIGDTLLFSEYDACLNLGGFANASYSQNEKVIAYDLCAVNTVLNFLAEKRGLPYDNKGQLAQSGTLVSEFYSDLEALNFYKKASPKSLGIEWVHATIYPLLDKYKQHSLENLIHTYTFHVIEEIGRNFTAGQSVLVTGGGAKNTYLIQLLQDQCNAFFHIPEERVVDFKEALVFGFLGILRLRHEVNCLASVTGASKNHSSGIIFYPRNDR